MLYASATPAHYSYGKLRGLDCTIYPATELRDYAGTPQDAVDELRSIVESITFEGP